MTWRIDETNNHNYLKMVSFAKKLPLIVNSIDKYSSYGYYGCLSCAADQQKY